MNYLSTRRTARRAGCTLLFVVLGLLAFFTTVNATDNELPSSVSVAEHRCGFDELRARTQATRVIGISRVVKPTLPQRSIDSVATPTAGSTDSWQPIRIRVFTNDMDNAKKYCTKSGETRPDFQGGTATCASADVFTDAKKTVLTELLIPSAIKLHEDRLNVQRVDGNIVVAASTFMSDSICGQFTIPSSHTTTGVSDADFLLYMSAGPTDGNTIAWATTCQLFSDGRPSVGVSNVSPKYISADPQTVRVIAHELLHALGFSITFFESYEMASTASLRGKGFSPVLTSANVVAQAQAQYGCTTQTFMELEDEGGAGTANSHWKRRSAKDELMAGISGVGHYTALTIAAMEDMGFYKGNYANAEPMSYGQNAGCALTTSKCVVNGVPQFTEMFCADTTNSGMTCTSDHTGIGYCAVSEYTTALPSYFQYFSNPTYGGSDDLMDYCPYIQAYSNTNCSVDTGLLLGNTYGVNSRCFNVPTGFVSKNNRFAGQQAICASVECGTTTYGVKVSGASSYTTCTPGATFSLPSLSSTFSSGTMTCPSYDDVCIGQVNSTEYQEYIELLGDAAFFLQPSVLAAALVALMVGVLVG